MTARTAVVAGVGPGLGDLSADEFEQDRSAWTLEMDLRPHVEEF